MFMNDAGEYISALKERFEEAKKTYEVNVLKAITDVIKETLSNINIDVDNNSYYVEMMTGDEAEALNDELILNTYYEWYHNMENSVHECGEKILNILWEADDTCAVISEFFDDNSITFEIQFDGMEFNLEYRNTYERLINK